MAMTIRDFIEQLSKIEDQDQPVFSVWWTAEDFEYGDDTPTPTPEQFDKILDNTSFDWTELSEQVNDSVYYFMTKQQEQEDN